MRGKRWKMDEWGERIMKMEPNSCTEVKPLRTCRRPEAEITASSPPSIKPETTSRAKNICISYVPFNLEKNGLNE